MTETEHLLTVLSEECAEVVQAVSKALRFGLNTSGPGCLSNRTDIWEEMLDAVAVYEMLMYRGELLSLVGQPLAERIKQTKKDKVRKYMSYARHKETLEQESTDEGC